MVIVLLLPFFSFVTPVAIFLMSTFSFSNFLVAQREREREREKRNFVFIVRNIQGVRDYPDQPLCAGRGD